MDIFSHIFVVKIEVFVWKDEINDKKAGIGPFKNIFAENRKLLQRKKSKKPKNAKIISVEKNQYNCAQIGVSMHSKLVKGCWHLINGLLPASFCLFPSFENI